MSAKKSCVSCQKQIPPSAAACVFCGTRQPVEEFRLTAMLGAVNPDGTPQIIVPGAPSPLLDAPAPAAATASVSGSAPVRPVYDPVAPAASVEAYPAGGAAALAVEPPATDSADSAGPAHGGRRRTGSHSSQTAVTLFGLDEVAREAMAAAKAAMREQAEQSGQTPTSVPAAPAPASVDAAPAAVYTLRPTSTMAVPVEAAAEAAIAAASPSAPVAVAVEAPPAAGVVEWTRLVRTVMVGAGAVLMVIFGLGSSLLPSLAGTQLVLTGYYLVGGLLLVGGGLLPLPLRLRAALAVVVGAVPLFVATPSVRLEGWRGAVAALVFLVLPGALLLRARVTDSKLARALIGVSVALATVLYLVPADGVVPIVAAFRLLASGSLTGLLTGVFFLVPLAIAAATLTAFAPRDSSGFGLLWAGLVLLTASGAIIIPGLAADERSLVHLGVGLLAAGAAGAVGVAMLLDSDGQAA